MFLITPAENPTAAGRFFLRPLAFGILRAEIIEPRPRPCFVVDFFFVLFVRQRISRGPLFPLPSQSLFPLFAGFPLFASLTRHRLNSIGPVARVFHHKPGSSFLYCSATYYTKRCQLPRFHGLLCHTRRIRVARELQPCPPLPASNAQKFLRCHRAPFVKRERKHQSPRSRAAGTLRFVARCKPRSNSDAGRGERCD